MVKISDLQQTAQLLPFPAPSVVANAFRLARQAGRTIEESHAEAAELAGRIAPLIRPQAAR